MIRELLLHDLSLWGCLWQSTTFLVLGITAGRLLRRRPSRAYQALLFAMVAAVFVPFLSVVVRHYHLGLLTAGTPLKAAAFDAMGASLAKENRLAFPIERISSGSVAASAVRDSIDWGVFLLYVWITATIVLLARLAITFLYGTHLVSRAHRRACEPLQKAADVAASKVGLPRGLQARVSDRIRSPVVWCWTRPPVLLVPSDCEDGQTDWAGVVAHELAHCKRWDHLTGLLAELAVSLLPWNPPMWLSKRLLIRLGEEACDDWVVATGHPSEDYAESLLRFRPQRQMAFVPAVVHSRARVAARVRRILNDACGNPRTGTKWAFAVSVVVAGVAVGFAFAQTRPAKPDTATTQQEEPTPQSANRSPATAEKPEQPRYAARTFNSKATFSVEVRETVDGDWKSIGRTPSAVPLEIPACLSWRVWLPDSVKDWDLLLAEMRRNDIPGLRLGRDTTDADLKHLAGFTDLEFLDVGWLAITDAGLEHLKGLTGLQRLDLNNTQITDAGLEYLKGLSGLRALNVSETKLTDTGLAYVKELTRLQQLDAADTQIADAGLEQLKDLTGLQQLDLKSTRITDAGLEHLEGLIGLQQLDLENTGITDMGLTHLAVLTGLQRLDLRGTRVTGAGLVHLKGMTGLQDLSLPSTKITDAGLVHLQGLTRLRGLWLEGTQLTDAGLERLKGLGALQYLDLRGTQITDAGLEHLKGLARLELLYLSGTRITDAGLEHLNGLTRLQLLLLEGTQITDVGLEHLKGLTALSTLFLSDTKVTDTGLRHIQGMTELKYLRLNHTQITGAGLEYLQGLQKLETLELEGNIQFIGVGLEHLKGLTGLYLSNTGVTDAGLEHFNGLAKLRTLYLCNTPIVGAGLKHLQGLTELSLLDLNSTKVTDPGLENLRGMAGLHILFLRSTQITDAGLQHLRTYPNNPAQRYVMTAQTR